MINGSSITGGGGGGEITLGTGSVIVTGNFTGNGGVVVFSQSAAENAGSAGQLQIAGCLDAAGSTAVVTVSRRPSGNQTLVLASYACLVTGFDSVDIVTSAEANSCDRPLEHQPVYEATSLTVTLYAHEGRCDGDKLRSGGLCWQ